MNKMGEDLVEVWEREEKIKGGSGEIYYWDFKKVVKELEDKFNEMSGESIRGVWENLWKGLFGSEVVGVRKVW